MGNGISGWAVACGSCRLHWPHAGGVSEHERLAIEARPCPGCGAYTLRCAEPARRTRRGRPFVAADFAPRRAA